MTKSYQRYGRSVRKGNRRHGRGQDESDRPEGRSHERAGRVSPRVMWAGVAIVTVMLLVVACYYFLVPREGIQDPGDGYDPLHAPGKDAEDYWIVYPQMHVNRGQPVQFTSWMKQEASAKVLLILVHSEGCAPCIQQGQDIREIMNNTVFMTAVNSLDLLSGGTDTRADDCFQVFDPDGSQYLIPLTIILVKDPSGKYLWHSWEGVTGKENLEGWLRDAMYYRNAGVGG
jgi:hypothetical protein